jgi:hypothetical protein
MTCSRDFRNGGSRRGQAIQYSRDIIDIVFTCLPSKNCPRRDRAAAFFSSPFWDSFFFARLFPLAPTPSKTPLELWRTRSQQFRSESDGFCCHGKIIRRWRTNTLKLLGAPLWTSLAARTLLRKRSLPPHTLQISIEETPAFYVLVAKVPTTDGDATRINQVERGALPSAGKAAGQYHLSKQLIWQQQEPILDAVETGDETQGLGPLLILNRDNLLLYRQRNDKWELQDSTQIPRSEKTSRTPRGEIRFSLGNEKQDIIVLPGQTCDVTISEKIDLNCRAASPSWREGMFLSSPCGRSVWWLKAEQGDWSVPDRLLLRDNSLPKSAASVAELELPGPVLSVSTGRHMQSDTAVVFNLSTGNYEVYRITLSCAN